MILLKYLIPLSLLISISACSKTPHEVSQKDTTADTTQIPLDAAATCAADASWFDGSFDPKKDADAFGKPKILCPFHQFAWKAFIWLTGKVTDGRTRFDTLYADSAIFPDAPPGHHVLGGVNQAGSNGILVDQNGRAVYTTMMVNDIYRDFVIEHKLYTKEGMQHAAPYLNFPPGAMSLKAAWKIVQPNEDTSGFFTTTAPVQMLSVVNDNVTIAGDAQQKNLTVALVGFHIAVYVKNHPEAIWATFEQKRNAPGFVEGLSPNDPVSADSFTFYHGGTLVKDCNANNKGMNAILKLDLATQKMQNTTQACLQFPFGTNNKTPDAQGNRKAITELNKSVHQLMPENSVWKNYSEVGAVWFSETDALKPDWNPNTDESLLIGSTRLSNSTIETFTQAAPGQNECFGCHNTMALTSVPETIEVLPGKNVNTSHILLKNYIDGKVVTR